MRRLCAARMPSPLRQLTPGRLEPLLAAPPIAPTQTAGRRFEDEVRHLLFTHRGRLGIAEILSARSLRIDGVVRLTNGEPIPFECKVRLSFPSAAVADWQLAWFVETRHAEALGRLRTAVVFFKTFGHDWAEPVDGQLRGWRNWYREHATVHTPKGPVRVYLIQVTEGRLDSGPVQRGSVGLPWATPTLQ